jgi:hypothetical protein
MAAHPQNAGAQNITRFHRDIQEMQAYLAYFILHLLHQVAQKDRILARFLVKRCNNPLAKRSQSDKSMNQKLGGSASLRLRPILPAAFEWALS